jgi:hypothetical protein
MIEFVARRTGARPVEEVQGGVWSGAIIARGHQTASSSPHFGRVNRRLLSQFVSAPPFLPGRYLLRQRKYDDSDPNRYRR